MSVPRETHTYRQAVAELRQVLVGVDQLPS
jgi:hypothetical protein